MPNRLCVRALFLVLLSVFAATSAHAVIAAVTQTLPASGPISFADTAVGSTSTTSVQLTINTAGALTISAAASAGNQQEFTIGTISGCTADGTTLVASGSVCSFTVTFSPHYPGVRQIPLAATLGGQVYTFAMSGYASGPLTRVDPGYTLTTVGASSHATPVFNVPASSGLLYLSRGIYVDSSDNVYIADTGNYIVDVVYQTASPQLACLIITESPATFGASGTKGCADATSQPTVGNIYQLSGTVGSITSTSNTGGSLASAVKVDPESVTVDGYGNVYEPDDQGRIRVIYQGGASFACLIQIEDPTLFGLSTGATSCTGATSQPIPGYSYNIAGTGTSGTTGDGGLAISAEIINPSDISVDAAGDVFFSTFGATVGGENGRIRVIYNGGTLAGQLITAENPTVTSPQIGYIYSVAGGRSTEGSDGILATSSGLAASYGVKLDRYGNIYFSDKTYSTGTPLATAKVRVIYAGTSTSPNPLASLIALENPGVTAQFGYVYTIAGGSSGVTATTSTTNNVEDGVLATSSHFVGPYQIALDAAGDIYVADDLNNTIRRISATTGIINTIMGVSGTLAVSNGITSELYSPLGVAVSSGGNVYFTDNGAYRLRVSVPMDSAQAQAYATAQSIKDAITLPSGAANAVSTPKEFLATNIGTSALSITTDSASSGNPSANFGFLSPATSSSLTWPGISECAPTSTTTLTAPSILSTVSLLSGQSCQVGVAFEATTAGSYTGTATFTDNSQAVTGTVHSLYYSATATGVGITLATTPVAPTAGQSTQLTATLVNGTTAVTSGTVTFSLAGGASLGSATVTAAGTASITTTLLVAGTDTINVVYSGDATTNSLFTPATLTTTITVAALPVPTVTITASPTAVNAGASVTLTAKITSTAGTPTGAVNIVDTLGTAGTPVTVCSTTALDPSGTFACTLTNLPAGTNTLKATYGGDTNFAAASSTTSAKVTVTPLATTTTVAATPASANVGQSVTITATVGGYVAPVSFNGTVTFQDKFTATNGTTTTINYGPVNVGPTTGIASYTSTSLAAGSHVFTASFANDSFYAASSSTTSATVAVVTPSYSVTPTASNPAGTIVGSAGNYSVGLVVPQNSSATVSFSLQTVGGYTGTVTSSCVRSSASSSLTCSMSPASVVFSGANNTVTVTGTISATTATALNETRSAVLATLAFPGAALLLLCVRRKTRLSGNPFVKLTLVSVVTLAGLSVFTGCGSGTGNKTPLGTYSVSMNFTDGTTSFTVPVTVTVQGQASQ